MTIFYIIDKNPGINVILSVLIWHIDISHFTTAVKCLLSVYSVSIFMDMVRMIVPPLHIDCMNFSVRLEWQTDLIDVLMK